MWSGSGRTNGLMNSMMPSKTGRSGYARVLLCALLAASALCSAGCQLSSSRQSRVRELMEHEEYPIAQQLAPNFTEAVLHALVDAEARAARR